MKLSDRLETILKMAGTGNRVLADIGTDHGFTAIEAVRRGVAAKAVACDIGDGPLGRAREHVAGAGLESRIDLRLADGLEGLSPGEADIIIISGMGGGLVSGILERGLEKIGSETFVLVSPQSEFYEFRRSVINMGLEIEEEACLLDEGKYYFILRLRKGGEKTAYEEQELAYGRKNLFGEEFLAARADFLLKEIEVKNSILEKLEAVNPSQAERINKLKKEISLAKQSL